MTRSAVKSDKIVLLFSLINQQFIYGLQMQQQKIFHLIPPFCVIAIETHKMHLVGFFFYCMSYFKTSNLK